MNSGVSLIQIQTPNPYPFPSPLIKSTKSTKFISAVASETNEIRVCTNRTCRRQGSSEILQVLSGIAPPNISVNSCGCLGRCGAGPNLVVFPSATYVNHCATAARAADIMSIVSGFDSVSCNKSLKALAMRKKAEVVMEKGDFETAELLLSQEQGLQESGASSSSFCRITINDLEESVPVTQKPFVQENVLSTIYKGDFPCTAGQFFNSLLRDGSNFTHSYHSDLMNVNLKIGRWHSEKEYDGQVREITFRPTIQQLFCTTFIASTPEGMTKEKQRILLSPDKRSLVFETLRQNAEHGFFKAHCRWELKTESESSCSIEVKVGVPSRNVMFRIICKWFFINKFKKELKVMLEVARSTIPTNGPIEAPHRSRCLQYTYFLMQSLMDLLLAILSLSHVGPPIIIQI